MRVVGVVSKLQHEPGVYGEGPRLEGLGVAWETVASKAVTTDDTTIAAASTLSSVVFDVSLAEVSVRMPIEVLIKKIKTPPIRRIEDLPDETLIPGHDERELGRLRVFSPPTRT